MRDRVPGADARLHGRARPHRRDVGDRRLRARAPRPDPPRGRRPGVRRHVEAALAEAPVERQRRVRAEDDYLAGKSWDAAADRVAALIGDDMRAAAGKADAMSCA
jgi:hypothetical protein